MRDFVTGLAFVIAGVATIITAQQFPTLPSLQYGPSLFPSIVGAGFCIGGAVLAANALWNRKRAVVQQGVVEVTTLGEPTSGRAGLAMLLPPVAILFYIFASDYIGAMLTMTVIMFVLMILRKTVPWVALVASLLVALAIYFIFSRYLLVPLPQGVLIEGRLPWIF
ncbi:tripartite tricarboxylate transporter TctB family protein [Halomonas sp. DWK9]|uniref:tripartite tricarboxylate transporter TctB family protein n=1 Tax=Halomonas sp. DWK9 TaxID=3060155 RepID=UPI00287F78ED|nr:tripartite tricarboxylate transporter TctB family protein [Halomonas sp. DWK9]